MGPQYPNPRMRIAIDVDSTLHHYWDQLAAVAHRSLGVAPPCGDQMTWGIAALQPGQLRACMEETHAEEHVLAAEPYPGAVETVARWRAEGHWIHVTSHRSTRARGATARWLE